MRDSKTDNLKEQMKDIKVVMDCTAGAGKQT